ncbi:hypothetical protein ACFOWZ_47700 [Lentzea rhizosphaerae]|uniref:Uncharacterized protein n=1 Tax=Lentzea rhizosphaerae TaxID=2041025 RepID=A0ABV8CB30_9PSEU
MNVEDELRGALDVSAPPATTTLDDVLRRGRRRLFARRAGAAFGAMAVVAVIGIGGAVWNQAGPSVPLGNPGQWPRVSETAREPMHPNDPNRDCGIQLPAVPLVRNFGGVAFSAEQLRSWRKKAQAVISPVDIDSEIVEDVLNTYDFDVVDERGTGSVRLSAGTFSGTPSEAADEAVWANGSCEPPRRAEARDGTVYQLYDLRWESPTKTQTLHVYRPDGHVFRIVQSNRGRAEPSRGRETLPLTVEQLVKLGPAVAAVA